MRQRLLLVVIAITMANRAHCAEPGLDAGTVVRPAWLAESALKTDSVLRPRKRAGSSLHHRPKFGRRPTAASSRPFVWLINGDAESAGSAYVGIGSHSEPELSPEDLLSSDQLPSPPDPAITYQSLQEEPVPIDGAAEQAGIAIEKETTPADSQSSFAWIAGTGDQLGMLEWVDRDLAVFDYSVSDRATVHIEPGFAMRWLTGPDVTDLPPYLFSIVIDVGLGGQISPNWSYDIVITPSWNTDFANKSHQLFRLPWQAVNSFKLNDELKLVLGVTDLDREDIQFLPVAGLIYKPLDGSQQLDLVFPRPKAAWRLSRSGEGSTWGYVAGELGGGSFSIQRPGAIHDIVTLRDFRLLFGFEHRGKKRHANRIEAGWVFGRAVEYASGVGDYDPGQTAIIRLSNDF
jgi:hypothetical protein